MNSLFISENLIIIKKCEEKTPEFIRGDESEHFPIISNIIQKIKNKRNKKDFHHLYGISYIMKIKNPYKFSAKLSEEDVETLTTLKEKFGINLSGAFKLFLRKYREHLEENDKDLQI